MKRVHGAARRDRARGASETELLRIFVRVGEAVAFAHAQGVVHCDLKPSNVMVGAFGEVLVLDWGVAKAWRPARSAANGMGGVATRVGTPGFMRRAGARRLRAIDAQSDVYSLGALLRDVLAEGRIRSRRWRSSRCRRRRTRVIRSAGDPRRHARLSSNSPMKAVPESSASSSRASTGSTRRDLAGRRYLVARTGLHRLGNPGRGNG